jgi:hypothetical protein
MIDRPLVLVGFQRTFAAENLRMILNRVSAGLADRLLGHVHLVEHLYTPETQWLWGSAAVRLEPVAKIGHYQAFELSIRRRNEDAGGAAAPVRLPPL